MKAMVLREFCEVKVDGEGRKIRNLPLKDKPLSLEELPKPSPGPGEILVKVSACGVCHTEIDEIEGRLNPNFPIIPGHEIVGRVEKGGAGAGRFKVGNRVGIAWINSSCGRCDFCKKGLENLCKGFKATGLDRDGGYAEYTLVSEKFAYRIPERFTDCEAAPLLCAGVVGYRALKLTDMENGDILGLYGFGASAHIVIQIAKYKFQKSKVFVFTRPGQKEHKNLAKKLGADWVGSTGETPPRKLNCAIDFTPVCEPVRQALRNLKPSGRVVINAIRKIEPISNLDYAEHIWYEKELKSVANVTRRDAEEFLPLAAEIPIIPKIQKFTLKQANEALVLLKQGKIQGAGVLQIG